MSAPQPTAPPTADPLRDAVEVMDRLYSPGGCPWDREQTHASLVHYLLEEAHELAEAIETDDRAGMREELGDLLLQVLFHARIASEEPDPFTVDDVAADLVAKLVRRHPHVFGDQATGTSTAPRPTCTPGGTRSRRRRSSGRPCSRASRTRRARSRGRRRCSRAPGAGASATSHGALRPRRRAVPRTRPPTRSAASCTRWSCAPRRRASTPRRPCAPSCAASRPGSRRRSAPAERTQRRGPRPGTRLGP
ncbi:MazG nucleotide pyrophosphohydrolase domain-containing protein [Cellulosimicrobium sp. CUA-896]|uniref:MazG nucleotide pyrophosphohydrolase domain-containing protein n=1 Tax=Cellulosimicrobium sp. CUA-896 TaxID=1517881 RepID=UPI002100D6E9|nr:MazG nucleotide pyrophosphohydrolase domain-containing protein [Cellulosimicrobium sp. CUA-896]